MLKLKLQYFGHLMQRTDSFEKTLMLGKTEGRTRRGRQRMRWLDGITTQWTWVWASSRSWWWTGKTGMLQSMGVTKSQTWLSDWADCLLGNAAVLSYLSFMSLLVFELIRGVCADGVELARNLLLVKPSLSSSNGRESGNKAMATAFPILELWLTVKNSDATIDNLKQEEERG